MYIRELILLARTYVDTIHLLFVDQIPNRLTTDVPSLHRMIELLFHTIPNTIYVSNTSDRLFETKHQPLKRCYESERHPNSSYAQFSDTSDTWKFVICRIHHEQRARGLAKGSEEKLSSELRQMTLDKSFELASDFEHDRAIECINDILERIFTPPFAKILRKYMELINSNNTSIQQDWTIDRIGRCEIKSANLQYVLPDVTMRHVRRLNRTHLHE